jgi:hypothetical protein
MLGNSGVVYTYSSKLRRPILIPGILLNVVHPNNDVASFCRISEVVALNVVSSLAFSDSRVREQRDSIRSRETLAPHPIDKLPLAAHMCKKCMGINFTRRNLHTVDPDHTSARGQEQVAVVIMLCHEICRGIVTRDGGGVLWEVLYQLEECVHRLVALHDETGRVR